MKSHANRVTVEADAGLTLARAVGASRAAGESESRLGAALRAARWTLRRWSLKHIWYRARLPIRRRRWTRDNIERTNAFAKDPAARPTTGPALAFGAFSGAFGLGRAAAYDLPALQARHASVTTIDITPYLKGAPRQPLDLGGPFENVYFLCQPDTYGMICALLRPSDIATAYRVGRWVWETPRFPEDWRFAERLAHEVWTPSEYCAAAFRAALDLPVCVVPYAVTAPPDSGLDMRARLGVARDAFMGLAVMDILSCPERKNPWAHVRAWQAAFGDDPAAGPGDEAARRQAHARRARRVARIDRTGDQHSIGGGRDD